MLSLLFYFLLIIIKANGECSRKQCVFGQCRNDKCICDAGVTGSRCNTDIIDCDVGSCLNNGTCIELINGFICRCQRGFTGPRCKDRSCSSNFISNTCLNRSTSIKPCSVVKFSRDSHERICVSLNSNSLRDIQCQCEYEKEDKRWISCQLSPSLYSDQSCLYRKPAIGFSARALSSLANPITIPVCLHHRELLHHRTDTDVLLHNVQCELLQN